MQESELNYFRDVLKSRKEQILKNINGVNSELSQLNALQMSDESDQASVDNNSLVESKIGQKQLDELQEIDNIMKKINDKTYGICEMCEEKIGFQRLKVKPHALYCIECRKIVENSKS